MTVLANDSTTKHAIFIHCLTWKRDIDKEVLALAIDDLFFQEDMKERVLLYIRPWSETPSSKTFIVTTERKYWSPEIPTREDGKITVSFTRPTDPKATFAQTISCTYSSEK